MAEISRERCRESKEKSKNNQTRITAPRSHTFLEFLKLRNCSKMDIQLPTRTCQIMHVRQACTEPIHPSFSFPDFYGSTCSSTIPAAAEFSPPGSEPPSGVGEVFVLQPAKDREILAGRVRRLLILSSLVLRYVGLICGEWGQSVLGKVDWKGVKVAAVRFVYNSACP